MSTVTLPSFIFIFSSCLVGCLSQAAYCPSDGMQQLAQYCESGATVVSQSFFFFFLFRLNSKRQKYSMCGFSPRVWWYTLSFWWIAMEMLKSPSRMFGNVFFLGCLSCSRCRFTMFLVANCNILLNSFVRIRFQHNH